MFPKHPFFLRFHVKFQCPQGLDQFNIEGNYEKKKSLHFHPSSLFPPAISVLSGSGSTKSKSGRDKAINGFTLWAVETTQFMCLKGECRYFTIIIYNIYGIIGNVHVCTILREWLESQHSTSNMKPCEAATTDTLMWKLYFEHPRNTWVDFALCVVFKPFVSQK